MSLRERKKERTRQAIADAAIAMFLRDGFDDVSTADVAAAVEISKPTLFRYFPTKEDLVVHRFDDHIGEAARVVRGRAAGETPLAALHRTFRAGLERRDPVTGLCDHPQVLAFHRLVFETPSLASRVTDLGAADVDALTAALREAVPSDVGLRPRLLATQVVAVQQALARTNAAALVAGTTADELYPRTVTDVDDAFALLGEGAAGLGY
ncbi:MAG: hypothetical protein QOG20_2345 [Pseudonocardiales bacterium]|nr:hypothetical protein [Pseudonocardiales bacterium]